MPFPFFLRRREDAHQVMHLLVFRQLHASHLQSNRLAADTTIDPVNCSGSVGIVQEKKHPESCPAGCPLGVLSTAHPRASQHPPHQGTKLPGEGRVIFTSPAWGVEGIPTHLCSRKAPRPGRRPLGELCSCRGVFRWVWALGRCLSTVPLLPSHSQPSPLHPWDGREPNSLWVNLTQTFSLSLETPLYLLFTKTPC